MIHIVNTVAADIRNHVGYWSTVGCRYNTVQYITILHSVTQWPRLNSQKHPISTSGYRARASTKTPHIDLWLSSWCLQQVNIMVYLLWRFGRTITLTELQQQRTIWCYSNTTSLSQLIEAGWRIYASVNYPALYQTMACRLAGAKPFSEPMLGYC